MSLKKLETLKSWSVLKWVVVILSLARLVECQDTSQIDNPAARSLVAEFVYKGLSNVTTDLYQGLGEQFSYCVKDPKGDWDKAFNFTSNLDFVTSCLLQTRDVTTQRICTAAEMKLYFYSFFEASKGTVYLKPNRNCNLTSWGPGCEPGWACSVGQQPVDLKDSRNIPARTQDCKTCCEGFFCPQGLTCMIPCPLGSYCPLATLNQSTGICEPYNYQLSPGKNSTCGGANIWADVGSSKEIFCSAGSYCPTTTSENSCSNGHYCRTGSTSEQRCFKLTSCDPNTANQNMHAYGAMLMAAIITLLLIIYNCFDQVLTTRERRLAKSREAAARNVRETAKARQRWQAAKDAAKKQARGLQDHLSRTFSRKKSIQHMEKIKIFDQAKHETDDDLYPHSHSITLNETLPPPVPSNRKKKESGDLTQKIHEIEHDHDNHENLDFELRDVKRKGHASKTKHISTQSQIFNYAYAQLEKEKAQQQENKNLTFSGVISMATNSEVRKRPLIEVSFKDLTLTLKAKEKHLLRSVTGKIRPGRITAVMGPSGAGKTTFLSALAGKATACKRTGLILINGKNESIHSYKKIIGFVPQDDIVHGNLTVEENLWFNAKCRLSADLAKADRVLVVERVIDSLGLHAVRDSLVGTVEKRGISGGQRKRVNVGLEMVMEPSLLFLDEPTSGLDSASSQLLLRALRREALEGVNICMVVHQPSYSLFRMFDDLVLLAKGGLTVYLGSVKKVEEYFAGIGINVPERVNPPDHLIDILEGIVAPSVGSNVNYKELPVRWMLYNGYPVPPDMQQNSAGLVMSPIGLYPVNGTNPDIDVMGDNSFAGELWQDVRNNVELHRDKMRLTFLKKTDLSNRRTPGVFRQFRYFLGRVCKQRLREAKLQAVDYLILLLAGACLGSVTNISDDNLGAAGYTYTIIAVSLLCKIAALRTFSLDKLQYWRESASGMKSLAYFLAKDMIDHFNTAIKPVVYLSMFYFFTNPRSSFTDNYTVLLCLVYCVTGIAYVLAIFFEPGSAQLWSVLLPVVLTLVATRNTNSVVLKNISYLCYPKWALQAFVIANAERYQGVWLITRCGVLLKGGYDLHDWSLCLGILILMGVVSRIIAFLGMLIFRKK
ncbi:hypothetical protein Q3G72_011560 [Acer saccharum]|nr:hypothetical protein Q3G72_011560 [Acer saccharum]